MMYATAEDIADAFEVFDVTIKDAVILNKLVDISQLFSLDADDLVNEWLAYQSKNNQCELKISHLDLFHSLLTSNQAKKKSHKVSSNFDSSKDYIYDHESLPQIFSKQTGDDMDFLEEYCTPANKEKLKSVQEKSILCTPRVDKNVTHLNTSLIFSPTSKSPIRSESAKYTSRSNSGECVAQMYAGEAPSTDFWVNPASRMVNKIHSCQNHSLIQKSYKYMFQKIVDVCDVLNDIMENTAEELQNHHDVQSFVPCTASSQSPCVTVGRIASESGGRLHRNSLLLEGDRLHSFGHSVSLDIESLPEYSLFPGQVVALRGTNPTGKRFVATDIYCAPCSHGNVVVGDKANIDSKKDFTNIFVAAGPFATLDTVSYQPLEDFITVVQEHKPDITILVGPLIDSSHVDLEKSQTEHSFLDLANNWISSITAALEGVTSLIFIPAQRDIFHHPVYPQPPYNLHVRSQRVSFLSDPCTFDAGAIRVGVTSTDVMFHLGAEEIFRSASGSTDRLARLARHLLAERSYYPLYPSHEALSVDWPTAVYEAKMPDVRIPDLLILPSDLKCFAKCVEGRACINPGRLTKGESGGTFGRIKMASGGDTDEKLVFAEVLRV